MASRKSGPQDVKTKSNSVAELAPNERIYDFGNTPVLIVHPSVNQGNVLAASITGYWVTRMISRETFEVVDLSANFVLPPTLDVNLSDDLAGRRIRPGTSYIGIADVAIPSFLQNMFPAGNTGRIDLKSRFYTAVFTAFVTFPFATSDGKPISVPASSLFWLNAGTIGPGGSLTSTSIGRILGGLLDGVMLCCGCGTPAPTRPAPTCGVSDPQGWLCTKPPHGGGRGSHFNRLRTPPYW